MKYKIILAMLIGIALVMPAFASPISTTAQPTIEIVSQDYIDAYMNFKFTQIDDKRFMVEYSMQPDMKKAIQDANKLEKQTDKEAALSAVYDTKIMTGKAKFSKADFMAQDMSATPLQNLTQNIKTSKKTVDYLTDGYFILEFPNGFKSGEKAKFGFGSTVITTNVDGLNTVAKNIVKTTDGTLWVLNTNSTNNLTLWNSSTSGATWNFVIGIDVNETHQAAGSSLAVNSSDVLLMTYFAYDKQVFQRAYDTKSATLKPRVMMAMGGEHPVQSCTMADANNNFYSVYAKINDASGIFMNKTTTSGTITGSNFITGGSQNLGVSCAVDANNNVHVLTFAYTINQLEYWNTTNGGTSWTNVNISQGNIYSYNPIIFSDKNNNIHVFFYNNSELMYTRKNSTQSSFEPNRTLVVATGGSISGGSSMADYGGNIYFVYQNATTPKTDYYIVSNNSGTTWTNKYLGQDYTQFSVQGQQFGGGDTFTNIKHQINILGINGTSLDFLSIPLSFTEPQITITSPVNNTYLNSSLLTFSVIDEDNTSVVCSRVVDGINTNLGTINNNTANTTVLNGLPSGSHNATVYCFDGTTNASSSLFFTTVNTLVSNCAVYGTNTIAFTFFDETNPTIAVPNTTLTIDLVAWISGTPFNSSFSSTLNSTTGYSLCFPNSYAALKTNATIQYYNATANTARSYYFVKRAFNLNESTVVPLYLLDGSLASRVVYTVKDTVGVLMKDVIVEIQRSLSGVWTTMGMVKTDTNGQGVTYMRGNDVDYRHLVEQDGTLLETFSATRYVPNAIGDAQQPLQLTKSVIESYIIMAGINGACTYNKTYTDVSCSVNDTTGKGASTRLQVYKNGVTSWTLIHDTTVTGMATQNYTFLAGASGNYFYRYIVVVTGYGNYIVDTDSVLFHTLPANSNDNLIIAFFIIMMMGGVGISMGGKPSMVMIMATFGIIISTALGFMDVSIGAIASLTFVVGVVVYKMGN